MRLRSRTAMRACGRTGSRSRRPFRRNRSGSMGMMQRRPYEQVERGDIRDELDLIGRAKTQQGDFAATGRITRWMPQRALMLFRSLERVWRLAERRGILKRDEALGGRKAAGNKPLDK